jgi:hypothetical protein
MICNLIILLDGLQLHVLSTATIGLLSSVQGQLAVASAEAEEQTAEADYLNIWTPKKFCDVEYWFLKTGKMHVMSLRLGECTRFLLFTYTNIIGFLSVRHEMVFWNHFHVKCEFNFQQLCNH